MEYGELGGYAGELYEWFCSLVVVGTVAFLYARDKGYWEGYAAGQVEASK